MRNNIASFVKSNSNSVKIWAKSNVKINSTSFRKSDPSRYHRNYFDGIVKNLKDIQKIYGSGWSMRYYSYTNYLTFFHREDARGVAGVASATPKFGTLLYKLGSETLLQIFYLLSATPF